MDAYKPYVSEFVGTFALVFIGAAAVLANQLAPAASIGLIGIALAHGLVLMAMIYALASFSGAHFNPAVTVAMVAHGRMGWKEGIRYILSQLAGAALAGYLLLSLFNNVPMEKIYGFPLTLPISGGVLLEAVLTFFLVGVIYGVAVNKRAPPAIYGLAIGSVLVFDILAGGAFTGAAMNPARAFGPALASGIWGPQAIYWVGPIAGALVGSSLWEYLLGKKKSGK